MVIAYAWMGTLDPIAKNAVLVTMVVIVQVSPTNLFYHTRRFGTDLF